MEIPRHHFPTELGHGVEFHRPRAAVVAPGTATLRQILDCPTYFMDLLPDGRFMSEMQIELKSEAGLHESLISIESVDRASGRVEFRVLRAYEAQRVPAADLTAAGMAVEWRGGPNRWSIVVTSPEPEVDPVVRSGYATERIAAAELARLAGTKKTRAKAAAA